MLSVAEAIELVVASAGRQPIVACPLAEVVGLTLAEEIVSDIDSPPFDKALMDGYAVRATDLIDGRATLTRQGEILAGIESRESLLPGSCFQIMTGAPMPPGADSVVMVERSKTLASGEIELGDGAFRPGQNVMKRGEEMNRGDVVLRPGHLLGGPELALLASVGAVRPKVARRPTISLLSTGDELVSPEQSPGPGQIRNSNESTLLALCLKAGATPRPLGVAPDERERLRSMMRDGLGSDVLLLSGGVSAGKRDLVPEALASLGVREIFHGVAFKPGKPLWFGVHEEGLVFGLPGNPVSVLACFEVFVRTALRARQGRSDPRPVEFPARLGAEVRNATNRLTYHPARVEPGDEGMILHLIGWSGSPDMRSVTSANALAILPVSKEARPAGALVRYLPLNRE